MECARRPRSSWISTVLDWYFEEELGMGEITCLLIKNRVVLI